MYTLCVLAVFEGARIINVVCFAGDEDDSVHTELETERDGPLAGDLCH